MLIWYFAYGSNMDKQRLIERGVSFTEEIHGILKGWRLCFNKLASNSDGREGYANIEPASGELVEGIMYHIPEENLKCLDRYEGFPNHYLKVGLTVECPPNGKDIEAVIYIANPKQLRGGLFPNRDYLNHLIAGERLLSGPYMQFLRSHPTLGDEEEQQVHQ